MSPSERELMGIGGAGLVPAPPVVPAGARRPQVRPGAVDATSVPSTQDFSVVYSRWMPALTRYCRGILRSDADAEDAAQNAMLKAMDALATGPAPERLPPWLHRIARNEAISLMRRRDSAVALSDDDHPAGPSLEEVASTRRRLSQLLTDLQALPERQREALVLREVDGLAHRDIAGQLGITEAAAQQAVLDARRSLHAFEVGRALECDSVQTWLSAHEHARLRTRGVRAHLRDCGDCRGFSSALGTRPRDLAALLPGIGTGGLVARIIALFGGGGSGVKAALATGVLATAGAGILVAPHDQGGPGAGARARPATSAPTGLRSRTPAPVPAAHPATRSADRRSSRARSRRAATVTAGRGNDAPRRPVGPATHASAPSPASGTAAGTKGAGTPATTPGRRSPTAAPAPTGTTPTTTTAAPAPTATPSLPPGRLSDAVAPVLDAVTETSKTTVDTATQVVDSGTKVVDAATQDLEQTVEGISGSLTGGG